MTEKELREIKRRFRPQRSNIPRIVGCFVNASGEIITRINQPLGMEDSIVSEKLLSVMKKTLSGSLGTTVTNVSFSTKQVESAEEHKLLMTLRATGLNDKEALERFYAKAITSISFDGNYVILLANDVYDVPKYNKNSDVEESTEVFSYLVCAVCPVKSIPEVLTLKEADGLFHPFSSSALLSSPEIGFMFPAFDDRRTNIYGALYYTRSLSKAYDDFAKNLLLTDAPIPPKVQKESFGSCLSDCLGEECDLNLVRSVHTQIGEMITAHKESKDPEPLTVTKATVKTILENCGVGEEPLKKLEERFDESFGKNAELSPKNLVSTAKFEMKMPEVSVKISPEYKDLVCTQVINGTKYLMIKVTGGVEVNGIAISEGKDEE